MLGWIPPTLIRRCSPHLLTSAGAVAERDLAETVLLSLKHSVTTSVLLSTNQDVACQIPLNTPSRVSDGAGSRIIAAMSLCCKSEIANT